MIAEELGAMNHILKVRLLQMKRKKESVMPNMGYCRFTNTRSDLNECLDAIRSDERLSGFEVRAGINMFKELLDFCRDYGIVSGYDGETVDTLFNGLKEKEEDEDA